VKFSSPRPLSLHNVVLGQLLSKNPLDRQLQGATAWRVPPAYAGWTIIWLAKIRFVLIRQPSASFRVRIAVQGIWDFSQLLGRDTIGLPALHII